MKEKEMSFKEYMEDFYKLVIRLCHGEEDMEKVARYLNGLRNSLQDEVSLGSPWSLEEPYQFGIKDKEKLMRKKNKHLKCRGRGYRGIGQQHQQYQGTSQ